MYMSSALSSGLSVISFTVTYLSLLFLGLSGEGGTSLLQKLTRFSTFFLDGNDNGAGAPLLLVPKVRSQRRASLHEGEKKKKKR